METLSAVREVHCMCQKNIFNPNKRSKASEKHPTQQNSVNVSICVVPFYGCVQQKT